MRISALSVWTLAAFLVGAGPALAFQEEPAAPAQDTAQPASQATPGLQVQTPSSVAPDDTQKKGGKVFGLNLFPKLDFGLELLYSQQPNEIQQPQTQLEEQNDLTVLGKVKRHF